MNVAGYRLSCSPGAAGPIASAATHVLVVDTNVVLDWFLFRDPVAAGLDEAWATGRLHWLSTLEMRDEFARVIVRDAFASRVIDAEALLSTFDAHAVMCSSPSPLGATEQLRCTDPDDQPFIDLAVARRAGALLTRDRALLRLASRARRIGVLVATPEAWLHSIGTGVAG